MTSEEEKRREYMYRQSIPMHHNAIPGYVLKRLLALTRDSARPPTAEAHCLEGLVPGTKPSRQWAATHIVDCAADCAFHVHVEVYCRGGGRETLQWCQLS